MRTSFSLFVSSPSTSMTPLQPVHSGWGAVAARASGSPTGSLPLAVSAGEVAPAAVALTWGFLRADRARRPVLARHSPERGASTVIFGIWSLLCWPSRGLGSSTQRALAPVCFRGRRRLVGRLVPAHYTRPRVAAPAPLPALPAPAFTPRARARAPPPPPHYPSPSPHSRGRPAPHSPRTLAATRPRAAAPDPHRRRQAVAACGGGAPKLAAAYAKTANSPPPVRVSVGVGSTSWAAGGLEAVVSFCHVDGYDEHEEVVCALGYLYHCS